MGSVEWLFYDTTTGVYFKSTDKTIVDHVRDIFYDIYDLEGPDTKYVDLIRELQDRLGLPKITDAEMCRVYSMFDGCMLRVRFSLCHMPGGTPFIAITYDHLP